MARHLNRRRGQLRALYGFDFPEDFFPFWEFATRLSPLEPLTAFYEAVGLQLVGPFEVLAGHFDGRAPRLSQWLHWRYFLDPPEFFTLWAGGEDGLHGGYYLDDPASGKGWVASYYAQEGLEFSVLGEGLFEALRHEVEARHATQTEHLAEDPENAPAYRRALSRLDALRDKLCRHATSDLPEIGEAYLHRYRAGTRRRRLATAATRDGMGIVVPPKTYRPLRLEDRRLWRYLRKTDDPADVVDEARRALEAGYPGTALKLGKELWPLAGKVKAAHAAALLDAAYQALGRDLLKRLLETHRARRNLPSVDILEYEGA